MKKKKKEGADNSGFVYLSAIHCQPPPCPRLTKTFCPLGWVEKRKKPVLGPIMIEKKKGPEGVQDVIHRVSKVILHALALLSVLGRRQSG